MVWYKLGNCPQRSLSQTVSAKINLCGVEHFKFSVRQVLQLLLIHFYVFLFVLYFLKLIPIPPPELFKVLPLFQSSFSFLFSFTWI